MKKVLLKIYKPLEEFSQSYSNKNLIGFTLIELLVVISIIGFLMVASIVTFNIVRRSARDATRVANIATLKRSLSMYLNDSTSGYPASAGECINNGSGVGAALKTAQVIITSPIDPLWPTSTPSPVPTPTPPYTTDSNGFCYYYVSSVKDQFQIYYFLESNSKSGSVGPHLATQ